MAAGMKGAVPRAKTVRVPCSEDERLIATEDRRFRVGRRAKPTRRYSLRFTIQGAVALIVLALALPHSAVGQEWLRLSGGFSIPSGELWQHHHSKR